MADTRQENGKIGRLPYELRKAVNLRLLDGQTTNEILEWLNAQPEAIAVWQRHFDGLPANATNLSNWRTGGYQKYLAERARVDATRELSEFCFDLAKAGGSVSDGLAARIGGEIMEVLESGLIYAPGAAIDEDGDASDDGGDAGSDPVKKLVALSGAIVALRNADTAKEKLKLDRTKTKLKAAAHRLDREKFETLAVKTYMEWAKNPEAQAILESGKPKHVQMDLLRAKMFGKIEPEGKADE